MDNNRPWKSGACAGIVFRGGDVFCRGLKPRRGGGCRAINTILYRLTHKKRKKIYIYIYFCIFVAVVTCSRVHMSSTLAMVPTPWFRMYHSPRFSMTALFRFSMFSGVSPASSIASFHNKASTSTTNPPHTHTNDAQPRTKAVRLAPGRNH